MQQRLIACALIFLQAWLLWEFSRQPLVPVLASVLALGSLPKRFRFKINRLWFNVATTAIGAFAIAITIFMPPNPIGNWLLPAEIPVTAAGFFLLLQVLESYRRREHGGLPLYFCLLSMLTIVFCYCRAYMVEDWSTLFWGAVGAATLVGFLLQASQNQIGGLFDRAVDLQSRGQQQSAPRKGRWLLLLCSFAGITFGTWYLSGVLSRNVEYFRFLLFPSNAQAQEDVGLSLRYADRARLDSISETQLSNPEGTALTVKSRFMPGYLRGRVYDRYGNNEWFAVSDSRRTAREAAGKWRQLQPAEYIPDGIEKRGGNKRLYSLTAEATGEWKRVNVRNELGRGYMFFTPLGTDYLEGLASSGDVRVDANDVPREGMLAQIYTSHLNRQATPDAIAPTDRPVLVEVPSTIDPAALRVANEIFANDTNDRQRIQSVESWFSKKYRYSLRGHKYPSNQDHLSHFILEKPRAHCEFFASAATVMLRTQGVPTRYVTGYAVTEYNEEEEVWIARNRHAHAWAEAYDREREQWFVVEATPEMEVPKNLWDSVDKQKELDAIAAAEKAAAAANGSAGSWFNMLWLSDIFSSVGNIVQIVLSLILMALLAAWLIRRRYLDYVRRRLGSYDRRFEREASKLRAHEKRLLKHGIVREESETLHQFVKRIRATEGEPWLQQAADAFHSYAQLRYST